MRTYLEDAPCDDMVLFLGKYDGRQWMASPSVALESVECHRCLRSPPMILNGRSTANTTTTDAFDVLLLSTSSDIMAVFSSFNADLVFGAELGCAPDIGCRSLYNKPRPGQPFIYLNSGKSSRSESRSSGSRGASFSDALFLSVVFLCVAGTYMGSAQSIREMLAEVVLDIAEHHSFTGASKHRIDDQRWFSRHYLRNKDKVLLDTGGKMFHTLHDVSPELLVVDEKHRGAIWSKYSQTRPCVLHGNGNGIDSFHDVSKRLVEAGWPPEANADATTSGL